MKEIWKILRIFLLPGSIIVCDEAPYYDFLSDRLGYRLERCDHSKKEFRNIRGYSTDIIEGQWGNFQRYNRHVNHLEHCKWSMNFFEVFSNLNITFNQCVKKLIEEYLTENLIKKAEEVKNDLKFLETDMKRFMESNKDSLNNY